MEFSSSLKYPNLNFIEASLNFREEIPHQHCHCLHCLNNTKPLPLPNAPRLISKNERKVNDSQAYRIILKNLAQYGFSGIAKAPDTFLIDTFTLVYSAKSGRVRMRDTQGNMEVKKHFDEQRRKGQTTLATQGHINNLLLTGISLAESTPMSLVHVKAPKEIAIMCYRDNTEQIITESLLSKVLEKRKNDPYWEDISHIMQIPPEIKHPMSKHKHHYQRTEITLPQLTPILERMGNEIDQQEERALTTASSRYATGKPEEEEEPEINPELRLSKPASQKANRASLQPSPKNKKYLSMPDSLSTLLAFDQRAMELGAASFEMVAFLEVTSRHRILNAVFEYLVDEKGRLFLCSAKDVIMEQLEGPDLTLLHDRYQPLEEIGGEELVAAKKAYDRTQEEELWKICTAVVNECLEIRKIELKLTDYKKPTNQVLLAIFLRMFPHFKSEQIFSSLNWKNELGTLVADIRTKINATIREDEGIRILRRFNIHFRRTFH